MPHRAIVSCDADSEGVMVEELRRVGGVQLPGTWLDSGDAVQGAMLLVQTDQEFPEFSDSVESYGSIFARHLAPVQIEIPLEGTGADLDALLASVPDLTTRMDAGKSFSVQSRILGEGKLPYRKVVLNEALSNAIEESLGAPLDCRWPEQVISILCTPDRAYLGISLTEQNRSAWPGGKHRFKKDDDQVSRAEFKLLEAASVFDLEIPSEGLALDIGASPGGWTRLLAAQGLRVDAVDPGELDRRIRGDKRITHHRKRIQEYEPGSRRLDVIVNDMKMDARDSIEIMLGFASYLSSSGVAVMTLKMPKLDRTAASARRALEMLDKDLERLRTEYRVVGARQLYHNRSEVTVAMGSLRSSSS
jgi:23S rRNA (cytidine2498-2'-O)-methyltransferase